jgi:alpha-glucosidase
MAPANSESDPDRWWHGGVFYQIYPRSYADSNGDGVGDLPGIVSKLDHLARLGISAVWLSPITCSPNRDWGYDVSDYRDIDPSFGSLEDLDVLVREAGARGIRILMDLVPNHTSDQHAWFVDALSGRDSAHRDYYVWADPKPDGGLPNNWVSIFGGPAWHYDEASGQYYLHNFEAQQPDLNWWNEDVRREFDDIVRFWWDRGVAGFRIDVCNMMIKDKELRDNPPATEDDPLDQQFMGLRAVYNTDRPEAHDILQRWRAIADTYEPERLLIGETNVEQLPVLMDFYGDGHNELHGGFNFVFINAPLEADALRAVVEETEALLPEGAWPIWTASNHDVSRLATRWAAGDPAKVKLALLLLLTLRGTPFLYAGDEIGLVDGPVQREDVLDAVGARFWPVYKGRDAERTPMPWSAEPGGGFTPAGVRPWLPMADPAQCNVADQEGDPASVLELCRRTIAARQANDDLAVGSYRSLPSPSGTWAYARGDGAIVLLNMSSQTASFGDVAGTVAVSTEHKLEGSAVEGMVALPPWGGAVVTSVP